MPVAGTCIQYLTHLEQRLSYAEQLPVQTRPAVKHFVDTGFPVLFLQLIMHLPYELL